ncbi:glycosyltransferase [uncultured Dubosiella sp.]|uniref:MGDG synthase family glycosyltransferase n=1 Tax=uncultured Dubosiella sp. TaxID=1937011 RepID=UPI00263A0CA9|nr:glycosyltransferase [uncultured Dubosiella sp.]
MEALVLSCSTGGGHNSAAKAIVQALQERHHKVTFFDPYSLKSTHFANVIGMTYIKFVQHTPDLFGKVYALGDAYSRMQTKIPVPSPVYAVQNKTSKLLENYISEHHFDVIITTHLFCGEILTRLKRKHVTLPPVYFVATDYTCSPFVAEVQADHFVIPAADLEDTFAGYGIPKEKMLPFGIPTLAQFHEDIAPDKAKRAVGLDPKKKYFLISGGSIGVGDIYDTIDHLLTFILSHKEYEILVLVGNNLHLYENLMINYQGVHVLHLIKPTDHVYYYMKASEIFISKPGGLSSTEAAAAAIPYAIITPIPGCEDKNAAYFEQHGMAIWVKDVSQDLLPAIIRLQDPAEKEQMIAADRANIDPDAAGKLVEFIEKKNSDPN